jgi:hypothetical protein
MTTTSNSSSTEEQVFLVTLQECLQADNDKRTAAEVCQRSFHLPAILLAISRQSIKIYLMKTKVFYSCQHCAIQRSVDQ